MTPRSPLVSVVMPVLNGRRYLSQAIESILGQTFSDFELVVVDDGSSDDSAEIVARVLDPRVRLLRHSSNMGVAAALNHGWEAACGSFIARMDSDDISHPTRLERQVTFLSEHPQIAAVGAWARGIDEFGKPMNFYLRPATSPGKLAWRQCPLVHPTVMLNRALLGPLRYDPQVAAEDYDLWLRMLKAGLLIANLPAVLLSYRLHVSQVSRRRISDIRSAAYAAFARSYPGARLTQREYEALIMICPSLTISERWSVVRRCSLDFPPGGPIVDQLKYIILRCAAHFGMSRIFNKQPE